MASSGIWVNPTADASKQELAAPTGAELIGTPEGTVQDALDARLKTDDLATALSQGALISDATDTGGVDAAYTGGVIPVPTVSGRTTGHTYAVIASQNCRSEGPSRAVNVGSIYSWAKGNVSGNYSSRQSLAWVPQSANIASEECWVWGGFRGVNLASIYSGCENESNANLAARSSYASGRNSANVATSGTYAGRGGAARFSVTVASGAVSSVVVVSGGTKYQAGDALTFLDRTGAGSGAAATVATVDGSGAIVTLSAITGGSGYSDTVDATVDNGTGDFSANIASTGACVTSGEASANIASNAQTSSGLRSASIASQSGTTSGQNAAQIGSNTSTASGNQAIVVASNGSIASGVGSVVIGGNNSTSDLDGAIVFGRRVKPGAIRALTYGDSSSGSAATANRKFEVLTNGNVAAAGSFTGSTVFADYAEFFENSATGAIPLGTPVALDGRKVRPAIPGDALLGVVSGTALVVAGDSPFTWAGRFLTGEFGEPLYGPVTDEDTGETHMAPLENPAFDPTADNVPRSRRPNDWTCVGLLGQLHVRVGAEVKSGDTIFGRLLCMEIRREFDAAKGYAVAFCLMR